MKRFRLHSLLQKPDILLLDEPTCGLHHNEASALIDSIKSLRKNNNTVIVIEHDPYVIKSADYIIEIGPGAGDKGGQIVAEGDSNKINSINTVTSKWLNRNALIKGMDRKTGRWASVTGAYQNNLKIQNLKIPLDIFVGICGVSGSGKSSLLINTIANNLIKIKQTKSVSDVLVEKGKVESLKGFSKQVILFDQSKPQFGSIANFLDFNIALKTKYLENADYKINIGSHDIYAHKCSACSGKRIIKVDMLYLPSSQVYCETCFGTGFSSEAMDFKIDGYSLPDLYLKSFDEIYSIWKDDKRLKPVLRRLIDMGMGYLNLRQSTHSLSAGEAQRLKIIKHLNQNNNSTCLYIFDEPTSGLHMEDVNKLIANFQQLVELGHSVWVIEHHLSMLSACDYLIELGPGAGENGGTVIAEGNPKEFMFFETPTSKAFNEMIKLYSN